MKIRSGFVSNSSSSSFILGCHNSSLNREETLKYLKDHKNKDNSKDILVVGMDLGEGSDIFYLSNRRANFILEHEDRFLESFASWDAYVDPFRFECADRSFYELEDEQEIKLGEDERMVYRDYSSDSEDNFDSFVNNYFLTSDEWNSYADYLWGEDQYNSHQGLIMFKDITEDPNIPEDWDNVYVGINEFGGYLGSALFSCKKLTKEDLKRIRKGNLKFKKGVHFYNEFISMKKDKGVATTKEGSYNIIIMKSFFDKIKSLDYFLKGESDED